MIVVISGATGGYGRALCAQAKSAGHFVIAISKTLEKLEELQRLGECDLSYSIDYLNDDLEHRLDQLGKFLQSNGVSKIDLLVNNAGIGSRGASLFTETAVNIKNALNVNCISSFMLTRLCIERFSLSSVVNVSSRRGSVAQNADNEISKKGCSYAYRISKAALNMLTLCIEDEFAGLVSSIAVHPGKLTTGIGVDDASLSPQISAERLFDLISSRPPNGTFWSIEEHQPSVLPW